MKFWKLATATTVIMASTSANAALIERLGGLAYYDDVANLTWLADANAAGTSMNWADANAWAASLVVSGVGGWRLPDTIDVGNDGLTIGGSIFQGVDYGYNITAHSELSNMFYNVLGNTSNFDTSGVDIGCPGAPDHCLTNKGPFSNLQSNGYWSATDYVAIGSRAWMFSTVNGYQFYNSKTSGGYAWAVQSGDVSAIPVPAAMWLFGSGLIGLIGVARRRQA